MPGCTKNVTDIIEGIGAGNGDYSGRPPVLRKKHIKCNAEML